MPKAKAHTITDVQSPEAQRLFRQFAVRIREVLMADAAKQFGKVAGVIPKMKHGQKRTFQTKPLVISVAKKSIGDSRFNLKISVRS